MGCSDWMLQSFQFSISYGLGLEVRSILLDCIAFELSRPYITKPGSALKTLPGWSKDGLKQVSGLRMRNVTCAYQYYIAQKRVLLQLLRERTLPSQ